MDLWIKEYEQPERLNFAIELKDGNKLIGGIDVVGYDNGVPVIGYNLAKKYWNNGYMTEACKCLLNYLFSNGYTEVKIDAMVENIGSNRVIQKCGGIFVKTENVFRPLKNSNVLVVMSDIAWYGFDTAAFAAPRAGIPFAAGKARRIHPLAQERARGDSGTSARQGSALPVKTATTYPRDSKAFSSVNLQKNR